MRIAGEAGFWRWDVKGVYLEIDVTDRWQASAQHAGGVLRIEFRLRSEVLTAPSRSLTSGRATYNRGR
jgi:hypothetical protein